MSDNSERLRRSWSANADAWSAAVREEKIESRRLATNAAIVEAVMDWLSGATGSQPVEGGRRAKNPSLQMVLDLGCGEGWLTRELASRGVMATGVDASRELIDRARESGGGTFHALAYDELKLDETFDVVVANFSLLEETLPLRAIRALLQPSGALVIQTVHPVFSPAPYEDGWRVENFAAFEGEWPEPMPWFFRTLESWSRLLAEAGFVIAEVREPLHPERRQPLSLILICHPATQPSPPRG
ncbi:MAG TPA: class I SAM-dependent methyltransferase [Thermoanaerobaculia bacterium]|nr:class I SAM-dependent methyltransferase [Thermoanaerobaculia bacterium]